MLQKEWDQVTSDGDAREGEEDEDLGVHAAAAVLPALVRLGGRGIDRLRIYTRPKLISFHTFDDVTSPRIAVIFFDKNQVNEQKVWIVSMFKEKLFYRPSTFCNTRYFKFQ